MTIGLDLSVIQTPHRMRGIGATAINFVNNLSDSAKSAHSFVFYLYDKDLEDALSLLDLSGLNYEVRQLQEPKRISLNLPSRLRIVNGLLNNLRDIIMRRTGDPRIQDISDLDAFLQFDPMQALPKSRKLKRGLIIYDLIPYIMESDYLWSYKTARRHQNSRKAALKKAWHRRKYITNARVVSSQADELFAISQNTKDDYIKYVGLPAKKIKVVHLGIDSRQAQNTKETVSFERYVSNSWGYFPKKINLEDRPFLLFVGGADPRRRLIHLVAAFNNLRAQGHDICLVLAGDTMKGPGDIPVPETRQYIAKSSYLDDIAFLGFVTNEQREWLYANTVAMVYPSAYEGFGLPILEAMQHGTPVITYDNSSIREIANESVIYASDAASIKRSIERLLADSKLRQHYRTVGPQYATKFSWGTTTKTIIKGLTD